MKAEITDRLSSQPLTPVKGQKPMWLDVAIGVYIGGMALLITTAIFAVIISAAAMRLVTEAQENLFNNQIKQAEKNFQSIINMPKRMARKPEATQQTDWHKIVDTCVGFNNRAEILQENLRIPRLIDNYSSTEQMNDELKSLLETIQKDCHKQ